MIWDDNTSLLPDIKASRRKGFESLKDDGQVISSEGSQGLAIFKVSAVYEVKGPHPRQRDEPALG